MHKLQALLPLLGWFYITIFVFVLAFYLFRGRAKWMQKVYYLVFGALALFFAGQSILDEIKLYPITHITLKDSFEQKTANESGNFYETYYLDLRPALSSHDEVHIQNIDIREYYYARMFLYPVQVLNGDPPITKSLVIMDTSSLKNFTRTFHVLKTGKQKSLIEVEALATPSAMMKGGK